MNNATIGLDIVKNLLHNAELNRNGTVTRCGMLKRRIEKILAAIGHWKLQIAAITIILSS